jgi:hypothetical protein
MMIGITVGYLKNAESRPFVVNQSRSALRLNIASVLQNSVRERTRINQPYLSCPAAKSDRFQISCWCPCNQYVGSCELLASVSISHLIFLFCRFLLALADARRCAEDQANLQNNKPSPHMAHGTRHTEGPNRRRRPATQTPLALKSACVRGRPPPHQALK